MDMSLTFRYFSISILVVSFIVLNASRSSEISDAQIEEISYEQDSLGTFVKAFDFGATSFISSHEEVDEMLKVIKKENQGKTVILDLWGTFCKPCISDFKNSTQIKEDLKKANVEMVYLCAGKSSNPAKWSELIASLELKGTHIYMDRSMTNQYMEKFGFQRYPSYLVIDENGNYHKNIMNAVGDLTVKSFFSKLKQRS